MTVHIIIWSPNIRKIWKILFIMQFTILRKRRFCVSFPQSYASTQSNFLRNRGRMKAKHLQNQLKQIRTCKISSHISQGCCLMGTRLPEVPKLWVWATIVLFKEPEWAHKHGVFIPILSVRQTFQPSQVSPWDSQFGMPTHGHGTTTHGKTKSTNNVKNTLKQIICRRCFYLTHIFEVSRFEVLISRFFWAFSQNLQICMWWRLEGLVWWLQSSHEICQKSCTQYIERKKYLIWSYFAFITRNMGKPGQKSLPLQTKQLKPAILKIAL